ncbi:MAG: hypothetical protein IT454_10800 [Planctomycetes bacterium]|nr:hypothetical protein [Planctomycetota bacterium]
MDVFAWVDPVAGNDAIAQINDPTAPFKRLQTAIDTCQSFLATVVLNPDSPTQALVYAQPGVYGPSSQGANGPHSSGDALPIRMRDRVHVRGVRARDCVLRGTGDPGAGAPATQQFFPNRPTIGGKWAEDGNLEFAEILLDLSLVDFGAPLPGGGTPPWYDPLDLTRDALEVFQGLTFQGGDIQVWAAAGTLWNAGARAVVANSVFDLRHQVAIRPAPGAAYVSLPGPTFGVLLNKQKLQSPQGYTDQQVLLLGNTFVFGRREGTQWLERCRDDAVGIIDVTDPGCAFASGGSYDCDLTLRGVGNCGVVNNVFRTFPYSYAPGAPKPMAMLGIDHADTAIVDGIPAVVLPFNAFAPSRVGASNGGPAAVGSSSTARPIGMFSALVTSAAVTAAVPPVPASWDCGGFSTDGAPCPPTPCGVTHTCAGAGAPVPAVAIYDGTGTSGVDPCFAGEFLPTLQSSLTGVVDWRLLPGSPLVDAGYVPGSSGRITMANGAVFDFSANIPEANPFDFDGEGHGNPRLVEFGVDLGFDEVHLFTISGSYSNGSTSHHTPGSLDPDLDDSVGFRRWVILPQNTSAMSIGAGQHVIVHGKMAPAPAAGSTPAGWYRPPGTLYRPVVDLQNLPEHYRTRYIAFNDSAPPGVSLPTPWVHTIAPADLVPYWPTWVPVGSSSCLLVAFAIDDNECLGGSCAHWYFNSEAAIRTDLQGVDLLWSNLQAEIR